MRQDDIERLADRFLTGLASEEEKRKLNDWYDSHDDELINIPSGRKGEKENIGSRIHGSLKMQIDKSRSLHSWNSTSRKLTQTLIAIAASVLVILSLTFLFNEYNTEPYEKDAVSVVIQKSTKLGQKATFRLPDGTIVHLNAESSLEYPEPFDPSTRQVKLVGEAFFEVKRDTDRPFIVESKDLVTTVLGTSFNIKAYPDESDEQVWVASGKVKVELVDEAEVRTPAAKLLTQDQGVVFNKHEHIFKKNEADVTDLIAWKDGWLILERQKLGDVISTLERWYGVKILVHDRSLLQKRVTLKQNENLESVMGVLSYLADFDFDINNKTVTIKANK
ncbi:MAG: FecR domain-containing protein [Cyclobacteriaceae bacterium]